MSFEEGRRLREDMTIKFLSKAKNRRLADIGHPISRKVFGNAFDQGKNDQEQRNHPPRMKAGGRNDSLQGKRGRSRARITVSECLIDYGHDQRARGRFQHSHDDHREGGCSECAGVRKQIL